MSDTISRQAAIDATWEEPTYTDPLNVLTEVRDKIKALPPAQPEQPEQRWIPCSERLPEKLEPVNITWCSRKPVVYCDYIKDKPYIGCAFYHNDKWWWYSALCEDYLAEYGESEFDEMNEAIDVIAWQPLPEPYEGT